MTDEDLEMDEKVNEPNTPPLVATPNGVQQKESTDKFKDCPQSALPNIRRRSALRNKLEEETRCLCHEKPQLPADRKAHNRLIAACIIVFVFMTGEILGKELYSNVYSQESGARPSGLHGGSSI